MEVVSRVVDMNLLASFVGGVALLAVDKHMKYNVNVNEMKWIYPEVFRTKLVSPISVVQW